MKLLHIAGRSTEAIRRAVERSSLKGDEGLVGLWTAVGAPGEEVLAAAEQLAAEAKAGDTMLYCDSYGHRRIDRLAGGIRSDFDYGSLLVVRGEDVLEYLQGAQVYEYAGLYDLTLWLSRRGEMRHVGKALYAEPEWVEGQFAYVAAEAETAQREMTSAALHHLKEVHGYLEGEGERMGYGEDDYAVEASVVIPVKDRVRTIGSAVESALGQETDFAMNVIVVDNHSTDGTGELLKELAAREPRLKVIVPERRDLGIGGCWELASRSEYAGRHLVQLDSDDLYESRDVVQRIVDKHRETGAALVVGSYTLVNEALEPIAPGLIAHREWQDAESGRNNLLRVNGMGAPRSFRTDALRGVKIPNVSYGEDYAICLQLTRRWYAARIYESLYLCRRWGGNSDANLTQEKINEHNHYKDTLRSIELESRIKS